MAKLAALTVIVFICAMPLKRGNMLSNDVTPAPRVEKIADVFGLEGHTPSEKPAVKLNIPEKCDAEPDSEKIATETPPPPHKPLLPPAMPAVPKTSLEGEERKSGKPVCLYGFPDIFLFQNRSGLSHGVEIVQRLIVSTLKAEGTEVALAEVPKNESEHEKETPHKQESTESAPEKPEQPKLDVDTMQSFEEWKNLKLQEQEVRKAEEMLAPPIHIVRTKKTQVNYASQDCGAKILAHNKEARHVSAVLDENRDLYMLNPCSANIWFVIELCEPIQVQQLQLCNLELFSSAPKDFTVSVSERYPARDWHSLGTFQATNERHLQTFAPSNEEQMFAKYIKFEMLSHFSNEHFCPLTLARVLGVSMVDEYDESEQANTKDDMPEENAVETQEGNKDGAINTMFNMVKNAVDHVLNNGAEATSKEEAGIKEAQTNNSDEDTADAIDPTAESEVILVTNQTEVAGAYRENGTQDFITLIQTGNGEDISEYIRNISQCSTRQIPLYMPKFISLFNPITTKLNAHMCWFLEFFCKVSLAGCLVHYPYNYSCFGLFVPLPGLDSRSSSADDNPMKNLYRDGEIDDQQDNKHQVDLQSTRENTSTDSPHSDIPSLPQPIPVSEDTKQENTRDLSDLDTGQLESPDEPILEKKEIAEKDLSVSVGKGASSEKKEDVNDTIVNQDEPPLKTERAEVNKEDKNADAKISMNVVVDSTPQELPTEEPVAVVVNATHNSTAKNETSGAAKNVSGTNTTTLHAPVVINPGTNQKDSVFMRLSNRIRVLEQNMSLSSDYLETLSRRYKKQMDEMQRAFNQTTSKLLAMSKSANESDTRQNVSIQSAFAEIQFLSEQVRNLSLSHDQLNMQLVERHVCLIILEVLIFIVLFVTCLGRRVSQIENDLQRAERMNKELLEVMKKFEQDPRFRATMKNGHCGTGRQGDQPGKKLKRKKHRAPGEHMVRKNGIKHQGVDAMKGDVNTNTNISKGACEVEVLDKDPRWYVNERSSNNRGSWDGHPLALKLPSGHSKGRK